ncbi:transporter substrate-binding domain-containing protein [Rhizobium setariae]|nr:transporter substrate-binding domain-containing protein [Rhizobium setariae]
MNSLRTTITAGIGFVLSVGLAHAEDTIRLGMTPEPTMPFSQINTAGEWEGLEADLSRALCVKMQAKCEIKQMAWDGLIPSLKENKVDFIIGAFSITAERRKTMDFSTPYYAEGTVFLGAKSDDTKIGTADAPDGSGKAIDPATISGKSVGVQAGTVQAKYVEKYLPGIEVKSYDTGDNSVADLISGRVDYILTSDLYTQTFLKSDAGADYEVKIEIPKNTTLGEGIAYIARKGDASMLDRINAALAELDKDGTLKKLADHWVLAKN